MQSPGEMNNERHYLIQSTGILFVFITLPIREILGDDARFFFDKHYMTDRKIEIVLMRNKNIQLSK